MIMALSSLFCLINCFLKEPEDTEDTKKKVEQNDESNENEEGDNEENENEDEEVEKKSNPTHSEASNDSDVIRKPKKNKSKMEEKK